MRDDEANTKHEMSRALPRLSSLKILHILDHSLPLRDGYSSRTHNILREQQARGWLPTGLTSPKHEAHWNGFSQEREAIDGVCYIRSGACNSSIPIVDELRLMKTLAKRIEMVAQLERPDLLHAHSPILNALPALWVGRKLRIPVVYEVRALWEDASVDHGTSSRDSLRYKTVRFLETWACQRAAQTVVICNGLRDELINRGIPGDKVTTVFNGINPQDFRSSGLDMATAKKLGIVGKKVLGFIGSFNRYEGLNLLIEAVRDLSLKRADIALLLVGGGEMEHDLRNQIETIKMQDRIILTGRIPHEQISEIYSLIDIFVYPRYSIPLTEMVTPLKPLESMAMGRSIIASDIGGHRELIQDGYNGLLFKPGNIDSLLEKLNRLLDEPGLRNHLGVRALEWVHRNRSWEKTTSAYSGIYSMALEHLSG
jgi:PEP-CTERM/exosortase A-associated glycosyltransferase